MNHGLLASVFALFCQFLPDVFWLLLYRLHPTPALLLTPECLFLEEVPGLPSIFQHLEPEENFCYRWHTWGLFLSWPVKRVWQLSLNLLNIRTRKLHLFIFASIAHDKKEIKNWNKTLKIKYINAYINKRKQCKTKQSEKCNVRK